MKLKKNKFLDLMIYIKKKGMGLALKKQKQMVLAIKEELKRLN